MPEWSPYVYTFNNPIRFIDPDGRKGQDIIVEGVKYEVGATGENESEYVQETFAALNQIANGSDQQAKELVKFFATSDEYNVEISESFDRTLAYPSTKSFMDESFAASTHFMDFNATRGLMDKETGESFSPNVDMVHELGHIKNAIDNTKAFVERAETPYPTWGILKKNIIFKIRNPLREK